MTFNAETLGQIGTFLAGLTTFSAFLLGFLKRKSIAIWVRDRRDLASTITRLSSICEEAERHAQQAKASVEVQATTIAAQSVTIDLLRAEILDLKDIKRRFTALIIWLPQALEFMAFMESITTAEQRLGRRMPVLPEALMNYRQGESS